MWYVQYFWWEVKWVEHDTKIDEVHDKDCVEQEFQLQFYQKLGRTVEGSEVKRVVKFGISVDLVA